jgi:hypothetical protein
MIQLILIGLIILFVIVIFFSYRKTTEGFYGLMSDLEQDANNAISDVGSGMSSLSSDVSSGMSSLSSDVSSGMSSLSSDVSSGISTQEPVQQQKQQEQQSEITISGPGFNALTLQKKTELLKNIQKLIKNELISGRQTTNINEKQEEQEKQEQEFKQFEKQLMDKLETDALQQGKEYNSECKKQCEGPCPRNKDGTCPPVPDMSEYIRKDQIPCWNCTLDY